MRRASRAFIEKVKAYAEAHNGRIYAPILHPDFESYPFHHGPERFEIIRPHLASSGSSVLDIGSHWGYIAHLLDDLGYNVTALEASPENVPFLMEIRDLREKSFLVIANPFSHLKEPHFEIVFALNIFHHMLKTEERFVQLELFLSRLRCGMMIFQPHFSGAKQLSSAYRYMEPDEFAQFVGRKTSLQSIVKLGEYQKRPIYKLSR